MNGSITRAAVLGLAALVGCYRGIEPTAGGGDAADGADGSEGSGADGASDESGTDTSASDCDTQSASPLRRLSEAQYENTLVDLFAPAGIDVLAEIPEDLDRIPADDIDLAFRILDVRVSDMHARAYYRIARSLAGLVVADDARLVAIAGDCAASGPPSTECIDAFLDDFGLRTLRRPITTDEREVYQTLASTAPDDTEAWRGVIVRLLLTPQFLYHVELEGDGDDLRYELGAYELAARLSYHFWQSMPDAELFAAAEDGSILTDEGYQAQLDRVFADPRTQIAVDHFYDEWLKLDKITEFPTSAAFHTFAEGTTIGEPGADHLAAAQKEIEDLTRHFTWVEDGTLADLFLTELSFTSSPHLAQIYGVEPWSGEGEPPTMPVGERAGILTRMALLVNGRYETSPVNRGAAVRRRMMCEALPQPSPTDLPPGSLDVPPFSEDQTTRERYEIKTADELCQSCHALINPVGFALERYDAIGRYRSEELIIDQESGDIVNMLPIDATATLPIGGGEVEVASARELSEQVVASGQLEGCFARQYFEATFGRESSADDTCTIDALTTNISQGSLREAMRAVAEQPAFRSRRVE